MPRRKRSLSPCELFDDEFDDDSNSQSSRNGHPPIQRNAANARERARMRVLSSAFGRLKTKLPNIPPDTKLSKLDTLRLATMYIKQLRALAEGVHPSNDDPMSQIHFPDQSGVFGIQNGSHNISWPFGLHNVQHSTNRQQPFHSSSMEWNPSHEVHNPSRNTRLEDDAYPMHSQTQQLPQWYSAQNTNFNTQRDICSNNFDVFSGFNQVPHNQGQHLSHSMSTSASHHHQSTMSPIR